MSSLNRCANSAITERALRTKIRSSLIEWATFALKPRGLAPARHQLYLLNALEKLSRGETPRLILLMPPGSAKSTYASQLFPAWWIARNPKLSVITASHTAGLAEYFGRGARSLLLEHSARLNVRLRRDARGKGGFTTEYGGEYFAIGVNGAVTGRRADLALIDDPISSTVEADSLAARDRLWNWYRTELVPRLKPGAKVLLVMTRWHTDDLAGRLMAQGDWNVLRLPALAEATDLLDRAEGEALWPEWEDRQGLLAKQVTLGENSFAALFQQAPLPQSGRLFDVSKIAIIDTTPDGESVRGWDLAGVGESAADPDWTAGVRLLRDESGKFVVEDVRRVRMAASEVPLLIRKVAEEDGIEVPIGLAKDPGQAGLFQLNVLTRVLAGFRIVSGPEVKSKFHRAEPVASQVAVGAMALRRGTWNSAFLDELAAFPFGKKDDQVDALARAFDILCNRTPPARFETVLFIGR
jgi:predicted phage terminase large subunit-like protein